MHITIEVGANIGSDTEGFAGQGIVYAFEPEPNLFQKLRAKFGSNSNVKLYEYAVDINEESRTFRSSNIENGIGSLYELHPELINSDAGIYQCYREGFHNTYEVKCIRMDTFIEQESIEKIDMLWIDAQGNDFNVLKSFGDKISIVQAGRCECTNKVPLYEGINNHYEDVKSWLQDKGFQAEEDYWHAHDTEVDLKFWR
jgi:FkbM family methyltransferase